MLLFQKLDMPFFRTAIDWSKVDFSGTEGNLLSLCSFNIMVGSLSLKTMIHQLQVTDARGHIKLLGFPVASTALLFFSLNSHATFG